MTMQVRTPNIQNRWFCPLLKVHLALKKPGKVPECAHSSRGPSQIFWFQLWAAGKRSGNRRAPPYNPPLPVCQWFLDSRTWSGRPVPLHLPQGCPSTPYYVLLTLAAAQCPHPLCCILQGLKCIRALLELSREAWGKRVFCLSWPWEGVS